MLTLTIREGEKIHIGDDITISVQQDSSYQDRSSDRVSLAIKAPNSVKVLRSELLKNILKEG